MVQAIKTLKPCKPIGIKEAKRNWIPIMTTNKKGELKETMVPGGYRITFTDNTFVCVTKRGDTVKFSHKRRGPNIAEWYEKPRYGNDVPIRSAREWDEFCESFKHMEGGQTNIPALVLLGMEQADAELAAQRAA